MSTNISWASESWNPVTGCSKVSEGCRNCYAAAMAPRLAAQGVEGYTQLPWTYPNAASNVHLHYDRLAKPLGWRRPRTVFVNSMSDLWHEQIPDEFIDQVFAVMALCPQHTFQILTKRPERMAAYLADSTAHDQWEHRIEHAGFELLRERGGADYPIVEAPLNNVWLGTSTENQRAADERVPHLLHTPAAVRFVSCEPLLGPLNLDGWLGLSCNNCGSNASMKLACVNCGEMPTEAFRNLSWVIAGGESGPGYRPMDLDWARSLRDQAQSAGVAFFYKQSAGRRPGTEPTLDGHEWRQYPAQSPEAAYKSAQPGNRHTTAQTPAMFGESDDYH